MKWCEHIWSDGSAYAFGDKIDPYYCGGESNSSHWKFCPICGTPRPKEQTLADKLKLASSDWDNCNYCTKYWDILAKTAEEHFKNNGSLKTN